MAFDPPMTPLKVVLIGSSAEFKFSMKLFPELVERMLRARGVEVSLIRPKTVFGLVAPFVGSLGKWLFYLDKYLLFPFYLKAVVLRESGGSTVFHVCDHSNAMYTRDLQKVPHAVTCHDMIAMKSALGESEQHRTSWSGRRLQRIIWRGLKRAQQVACISEATRRDLLRITQLLPTQTRAIHMGQNSPYSPMPRPEAQARVQALTGSDHEYIFQLSSNSWYKNRLGVLKIYAALRRVLGKDDKPVPRLILAGQPPSAEMKEYLQAHPDVAEGVQYVGPTTTDDLRALYSAALLFLFPSWDEGFGWPVIEAQACGCPVAASDIACLREIGGSGALFHDPADHEGFGAVLAAFLEEGDSAALKEQGFQNVRRFTAERMIEGYVELYRDVLRNWHSASSSA